MRSAIIVFRRVGVIVISCIVLSACATPVIPRPTSLDANPQADFTTNARIYLMNGHSTDDTVTLVKYDTGETFVADRKFWTSVAIDVLSNELRNTGAVLCEDQYSKLLILTIPGANMPVLPFTFKVRINLRVETGDGYINNYHVEHVGHGLYPDRTADIAIAKAVKALLSDRNIKAYLRE